MQADETDLDPAAGARNLLLSCLAAKPGQSLLIVAEEAGKGYYDEQVCPTIVAEADRLGLTARVIRAREATGPEDVPRSVIEAMRAADHTVFLSRLGDQIRFSQSPGQGTRTICYALDRHYLGSAFGRTPWRLFKRVHDGLVAAINASSEYHITCELGTDVHGEVARDHDREVLNEFTVEQFPLFIYPPLSCHGLNGQLVLNRFLMSTSINTYEGSVLLLDTPVVALIEDSQIVSFEGAGDLVAAARAQYERVGELSGGGTWRVNSWHTGIYPNTFYRGNPGDDWTRWGDLAFGSPRYTHFHTCGPAPGNIATATFDATIKFDGVPFWERGRFIFLERPEIVSLLDEYKQARDAFAVSGDIGI